MLLSLLLCLAAGGMWIRSYWVAEGWGRHFAKTEAVEHIMGDGRKYVEEKRSVWKWQGVESIRGSLGFGLERLELVKTSPAILAVQWEPVPDADEFRHWRIRDGRPTKPWANKAQYYRGWLGFGLVRQWGVPTTKAVIFPYWFVMVCAALWPAVWVMRWGRRWRRKRMGRCVWCGYDLRGSGARCPECGNVAGATCA